jgi:hypothetical protein
MNHHEEDNKLSKYCSLACRWVLEQDHPIFVEKHFYKCIGIRFVIIFNQEGENRTLYLNKDCVWTENNDPDLVSFDDITKAFEHYVNFLVRFGNAWYKNEDFWKYSEQNTPYPPIKIERKE